MNKIKLKSRKKQKIRKNLSAFSESQENKRKML